MVATQNYDPLTDLLTGVKCRATGVAKNKKGEKTKEDKDKRESLILWRQSSFTVLRYYIDNYHILEYLLTWEYSVSEYYSLTCSCLRASIVFNIGTTKFFWSTWAKAMKLKPAPFLKLNKYKIPTDCEHRLIFITNNKQASSTQNFYHYISLK